MDSSTARRLYADRAHALAYVDVEKPNGDRNIGSAFHVGEGVFVTARHIVEGNKIVEVKITEPVALNIRWLRLSEQNFRVDKWSLCRG